MRVLLGVAITLLGLAVGGHPVLAASEAQRAYDACVDFYNDVYRQKKDYKAIVSGVSASDDHCYWSYGYQSVDAANRAAFDNCQRNFRKCYMYANSNGHSQWSARINAMGGDDGSKANDRAAAQAIGGFISGLAGAIISNGGGGGGGYGGSACTAAQRARGWSEERCIRN